MLAAVTLESHFTSCRGGEGQRGVGGLRGGVCTCLAKRLHVHAGECTSERVWESARASMYASARSSVCGQVREQACAGKCTSEHVRVSARASGCGVYVCVRQQKWW